MQDRSETRSQPDPMQRIQRNSQFMAWGCVAIMVTLPVALAVYWSNVSITELAVQGSLPSLAIQQPLQVWQRLAAGITMGVPLAFMLAGVVCGAVTSAILTWTNAPGTRQLSIAFGSNHIFTLFFAALVWMLGDVIAKGRALVEENEGFV